MYHVGKGNVVVDSLRKLFMRSTKNAKDGKFFLDKDVCRLAHFGALLVNSKRGGVIVLNQAESCVVVEVKEKK